MVTVLQAGPVKVNLRSCRWEEGRFLLVAGAPMSITPQVYGPYFAGGLALLLGVIFKAKRRKELGPVLVLAPILVAIGMAVFGADHLTAVKSVAAVVPSWMPARVFWAGFVGVALLAAATGLATGIASEASIGLLGLMILCFASMVFAPVYLRLALEGKPGQRVFLTLMLRDLTLSACYVAAWAGVGKPNRAILVRTARFVVAVGMGAFGILLLQHSDMAPGIPQDGPDPLPVPAWFPELRWWTYATAVIFVVGALGLLHPRTARGAALLLGITVTVLAIVVYLPVTAQAGGDVDHGLNYLAITTALAGGLLFLSAAQPKPTG